MTLLLVAQKTLREIARQPRNLALVLGLPLAFMVIFGLAFGTETADTYDVAVRNDDEGEAGQAYLDGLAALEGSDGAPLVRLVPAQDLDAARRALEKREVDAILVIPAGFTEGLTPGSAPVDGPLPVGPQGTRPTPPSGTTVALTGDPAYADYAVVARVVEGYTAAFVEQATGQPAPVKVQQEAATSSPLTRFDYIAPGLMVFAILGLAPQAASMLTREQELGTIERLRQSPAGAFSLLGGVALAQLAVAVVSLALMLAAAHVMGFHNQGSYAAAYVLALTASVAVVGIGMLIAAFARTQQEAANLGILVSVPSSFLSGAFFPIPSVDLFTLGGRTIGLYHVLPTTWATEALRQVLAFGRTLEDVAFALGALAVLSVVFFAVGAVVYGRARLAAA